MDVEGAQAIHLVNRSKIKVLILCPASVNSYRSTWAYEEHLTAIESMKSIPGFLHSEQLNKL